MAVSDLTSMRPPYPAREFLMRGIPLSVVHQAGGKPIPRVAIVDISPTTFLERGGARKVSSASVTFLEAVSVRLEDTIQIPDGEPKKVILVSSRFASLTRSHGVKYNGRLTVVLLA